MLVVGVALSGFLPIMVPRTAIASPAMSRQTGEPCSTCHDVIPKLNFTGQKFRTNGFRLPEIKARNADRVEKPVPRSTELRAKRSLNQQSSQSTSLVQIPEK